MTKPVFMTYGPAQRLYETALAARDYVKRCGVGLPEDNSILERLERAIKEVDEAIAQRVAFKNEIADARERTHDDLEIDDDPALSPGEFGVWVSAWIWVPGSALDEKCEHHNDGTDHCANCRGYLG